MSATGIMHSAGLGPPPEAAAFAGWDRPASLGAPISRNASRAGWKPGANCSARLDRGERTRVVAEPMHREPAVHKGERLIRVEVERLVVVRECAQMLSQQKQGRAAIKVDHAVVRVKPDCRIKIGNRAG